MCFILTACSLRKATRQSLAARWKQIYSGATQIKTCLSYKSLTKCGYSDKILIQSALLQQIDIQTREWRHMHTVPKLCSGILPHSQLWPIISVTQSPPLHPLSSSFFLYPPWSCGCCKTSVICYSQWRGLLSGNPCCCDKTQRRENNISRPSNFNLSPSKKTNNK